MTSHFVVLRRIAGFALGAVMSVTAIQAAYAADSSTKKEISMSQPKVKVQTNQGDFVLELNAEKAPVTTENFLKYVNNGFFDNLIFHRVIKGFMIQGGGFDVEMKQKATEAPIKNEADNGLKNDKYTIAMARTNDPQSATAQFFINAKDNDFLNFSAPTAQGWGYAVFGKVVEGQDVIDKIEEVKTGNRGFHQDVPVEPVVIEKASVVEN